MNKRELVSKIALSADINVSKADAALKSLIEAVTTELKAGGTVSLVGFGIFHVKQRNARSGRNPKSGDSIQIAACNVPGFKVGKTLKSKLN